MPRDWNVVKIALYAGIIGATYALLASGQPWNTSAGNISGHIGEMAGGGLGAAFFAGAVAAVRNALVVRR